MRPEGAWAEASVRAKRVCERREQSERQATSRRKPRCLRHLLSYAFSILFAVLWPTGGARASVAEAVRAYERGE